MFARHGIPDTLRADNVPFGSDEMKTFSNEWEFSLILSSPRYPKSNGLAEKGVQVTKRLIKKCIDSNEDINLALLAFRTAPNKTGLSPAQLLFGRQLKTKVPVLDTTLNGPYDSTNVQHMEDRQARQSKYHDRHAKKLPELQVGEKVALKTDKGWDRHGEIVQAGPEPRSYSVDDGHYTLRRNRVHLRKRAVSQGEDEESDIDTSDTTIPMTETEPDNTLEQPASPSVAAHSSVLESDSENNSLRRSTRIRKTTRNADYHYY